MKDNDTIALEHEHMMGTYGRYPVVVESGHGSVLVDDKGKKYLDFTSGIGVNSLGIADEGWIKAVTAQLGKIQHVSNYFYSPVSTALAKRLTGLSGLSKVFFSNSGAEANEGAIKMARKYSFDKYGEGRHTIITLQSSFHGRTITTLAATGQDSFHTFFDPFTPGFKYVPLNDISALRDALTPDVCAVMAEPIQGEGGVNIAEVSYLKQLRQECDSRDVLLILDEVQTGIGRTGKVFAYEHYGIMPDILTLAKGLGGGLPIGAFLCAEKLSATLGKGMHGTTFGSNPVVCAGALEVLDRVTKPEFLSEVTAKGEYIKDKVADMKSPIVKDIRGRGLMIGVQIEGTPKDYALSALEKGLLILTAGTDVLRFLPPLNTDMKIIDRGLEILSEILL